MFKCTGLCDTCGRCGMHQEQVTTEDVKGKITIFPSNFIRDNRDKGYGLAFDIGTTTVAGYLWNLEDGCLLSQLGMANPQGEYGGDIMARIAFSLREEKAEILLRDQIRECISNLAVKLCKSQEINMEEVVGATLCGNTVMSHLAAGFSVKTLGRWPFEPAYRGSYEMDSNDFGLPIKTGSPVLFMPNIASHVGGDISAGIIATRFHERKRLSLFIDIGTNGEIALTDGKRILVCSAAAGPAFEGASISQGMRAVRGAIDRISIEGVEVMFRTVDRCPPEGICGSGIIDAVAKMLDEGLISERGRLAEPERDDRITEENEERKYILVYRENRESICITQRDIREVQLAKGAILSAIKMLLQKLGRQAEEIEEVIIGGAFGNFIDKRSAIRIGMLPEIDEDRITLVGNCAGAGVSMALLNREYMKEAEEVCLKAEHVELATRDQFQKLYLESLDFSYD